MDIWTTNKTEPGVPLYDVSASCYGADGGSDGAYDLLGENQTAQEIGQKLTELLLSDWGLLNGTPPFFLRIVIRPAGADCTNMPSD